jgi:hypothetical protein
LTEIGVDIDGQQRSDFPYRGADEANTALVRRILCDSIPNPGHILASDSLLCNGSGQLLLTHQAYSTGIGLTHQWEISNDSINFQPIAQALRDTHTVYSATQNWYRVHIFCRENNNSFYSDTLHIYNLPAAKTGSLQFYHQSGFTHFQLSQSVGDSFRWDFGDGSPQQVSTLPSMSHVYAPNAAYVVTLWAYNRCGSDSLIQNVSIPLHTVENKQQRDQLYPSPSNGWLIFDNQQAWTSVGLFDLQHRLCWQATLVNGINQWDLSVLPAGLYHFVATNEKTQQLHFKWIKQ